MRPITNRQEKLLHSELSSILQKSRKNGREDDEEECVDVARSYEILTIRKQKIGSRDIRQHNVNPVAPIKKTLLKRLQRLKEKKANQAAAVVLTDDEVDRLEQEALAELPSTGNFKYPMGSAVVLLVQTGMRCGELLALKVEDYNAKDGILTIDKSASMTKNQDGKGPVYVMVTGSTKNAKARKIRLNARAREMMGLLTTSDGIARKPEELLVLMSAGKQQTTTNLEVRVNTIYRNAGIEASGLHILRRTFATKLYRQGTLVKNIAVYIGDLESTTLQYYIAARERTAGGDYVVEIPE